MSITTYGELKTAIMNWADDTELTAVVGDFVRLAEVRIRRDVRCRDQLTAATVTLTDGTCALPSAYLEARFLTIDGDTLEFVPEDKFNQITDPGTPTVFTIDGDSIRVKGATTQSGTFSYWSEYTAFSSDSDYNWLLRNAPDVYLFGALMEAYDYTRDADGAARAEGRYRNAVAAVNATARLEMASGPMRVRVG